MTGFLPFSRMKVSGGQVCRSPVWALLIPRELCSGHAGGDSVDDAAVVSTLLDGCAK